MVGSELGRRTCERRPQREEQRGLHVQHKPDCSYTHLTHRCPALHQRSPTRKSFQEALPAMADCCYLTGAPCCFVKLLPADNWPADDTRPQAPWDIASSTSNGEPTVQLKIHLTHQQCTTISVLQQPAPEAKAHIHANRQAQQQSGGVQHTLLAHNKSVNRALPPNTRAQILMNIAYNACFLLTQVLYCVLRMFSMALCTLLPLLTTSTWLFISMYATAVSIHTAVSENRQPSKCVQSPRVLQTCVILDSLLSITANLTIFIVTQVHCMLTLAAAYSFLAQPHWISACLIMLHAPKAVDNLTMRLTHVIEYAIQSLIKDPKQFKFAHPRIRNGTYWRRIRNRTRRLHKQPVYRYVKVLCWLHHFIQYIKPQQRNYSDKHASKPGDEHHTHMQGEAKCGKTGDRNAAAQHNTDQHRGTHSHRDRAASASALIRRQNRTKQRNFASTEARFTTQPCLHETHDAQVTCAVPTKVLCIDAPNCCSHALS